MKMKAGTRVVFTFYLIVVILIFLFFLATMFGLLDASILNNITGTMINGATGFQILYGALFAVMVIVGIALMFFGIKKEAPKTARVAEFERGSIVITVKAIEELIEKFVREAEDVRGVNIRVTSYMDAIDIGVELSVKPDTDIPQLTEELQTGLTEYIQKHTGIAVRKNNIMVLSIDDALKNRVD